MDSQRTERRSRDGERARIFYWYFANGFVCFFATFWLYLIVDDFFSERKSQKQIGNWIASRILIGSFNAGVWNFI